MIPSRRNNFDVLRLVLASIVVLVHVAILSGEDSLRFLPAILSTPLAIQGFFVISGYLVVQSYERSSSLRSYAGKRGRRIVPAYVFIIAAGLALGAVITTSERFWCGQTLRYVVANLAFLNFLQPDLPGVFAGNPVPAVNGALWTLKIEVMFYAAVPLLVLAVRKWRSLPVLWGLLLVSAVYYEGASSLAVETGQPVFDELARQLPGQLGYFAMGAVFHYHGAWLGRRRRAVVLAACAVFALDTLVGPSALLRPIWVSVLLIGAALWLPFLGDATRFGDLSYGVYIVHYPILQLMVEFGLFRADPLAALVIAVVLVVSAAWLLWHGLESRFLRRRAVAVPDSVLVPQPTRRPPAGVGASRSAPTATARGDEPVLPMASSSRATAAETDTMVQGR